MGSPRSPVSGLGLLFFIFLGNLSKSLYGTATFSGIAFWDLYWNFKMSVVVKLLLSNSVPFTNTYDQAQ